MRFLLLRQLAHPGVIRAVDFGVDEYSAGWLAMEVRQRLGLTGTAGVRTGIFIRKSLPELRKTIYNCRIPVYFADNPENFKNSFIDFH